MVKVTSAFTRRLARVIVLGLLLSTVALAQKAQKDDEVTAEERAKFLREVEKMVNQSSEGLTVYKLSDGTKALYLQERFQVVSLAKVNSDGSVSTECVNTQKDAEKFLQAGNGKEVTKKKTTKKAKPKPAPALEVK